MDISRGTDRRIESTPYLEKRAHEHDSFTKTNKTSCCDARAEPFVKQPSFLWLASQQGKP